MSETGVDPSHTGESGGPGRRSHTGFNRSSDGSPGVLVLVPRTPE